MKFVRPNKGLPLTFLVIGEDKSIGGEDIWLVKELGYRKTFGALKSDVHAFTPDPSLMEIVNGWLAMIGFDASKLR